MLSFLSKKTTYILQIYLSLLLVYSVFSYSLTTANLILINCDTFVRFQFWMWETFFNNRQLLAISYLILIALLLACFWLLVKSLSEKKSLTWSQQVWLIVLLCLPLFFSYNALSHDVFNYIFNSRMLIKYQANPHWHTAVEFPFDDWTRFMHNIHTPAPYGYGWTFFSLLPYLLGAGKFLLTWLSFRLSAVVSLILTGGGLSFLSKAINQKQLSQKNWALFVANPLVLIEVVSNSHNDLWMMFPVIFALGFLVKLLLERDRVSVWRKTVSLAFSWLLIGFSISIKFASMALLPVFLVLSVAVLLPQKTPLKKLITLLKNNLHWLPVTAACLMFLPLFTARSQQFHPWYLVWPLVWLPLINSNMIKQLLLTFSITGLLRYYPWLLANDYSKQVLTQQKIITWIAPAALIVANILRQFFVKLGVCQNKKSC